MVSIGDAFLTISDSSGSPGIRACAEWLTTASSTTRRNELSLGSVSSRRHRYFTAFNGSNSGSPDIPPDPRRPADKLDSAARCKLLPPHVTHADGGTCVRRKRGAGHKS